MRTPETIDSFIEQTKIAYSALGGQIELRRERGVNEPFLATLIQGGNIINALETDIPTQSQKSLFVDNLIRLGFTLSQFQLFFTEEIYNEDFDIVQ